MPDWRETRTETMLQHLGEGTHVYGAAVPPIFQNSTFIFETWDGFREAMEAQFDLPTPRDKCNYSRINNPSLDLVGEKLAALEKTECGRFFASGMAAITTGIMTCVKAGAHVVCVDTCYGPTRNFFSEYLPRFGVETSFVIGTDPQEVIDAIRPETTLIYLESPGSIVFKLQDLEAICTEARKRGIRTAIDNSYSTPIYQNPADFGVDIVLHTATKFLGGHSDIVAGGLATSKAIMQEIMANEAQYFGSALGPFQSWLILRSMRTLPLRVKQHTENATEVARWLRERPEVREVHYCGFDDFPQRELFQKQMRAASSLVCFETVFQDEPTLRKFTEALRVYRLGVSWGGHESLVVALPFKPMDWQEERWLIRLHCGLEHVDDMKADLDQAFALVR